MKTGCPLTFKQDVSEPLHSGKDHGALLGLVRCHQEQGLTPEEGYRIMQEMWLEFGFDKGGEGALQNNLEAVIEKTWYECPAAER
jgi:hypothetical protein